MNLFLSNFTTGNEIKKTSFFYIVLIFLLDFNVYIQTKEPTEYPTSEKIHYLDNIFTISEENFLSLKNNSVVILDDFSFQTINKQNKIDFLRVLNYTLRHRNITLFLIIHNLFSVGLFHEILTAPHIFIAYSNLGYYIIRFFIKITNNNCYDFFIISYFLGNCNQG
jgi:hypothetical protein